MANELGRSVEQDGWCLLPGFLDAGELALIQASVNGTYAAPRPACMSRPGNDLILLRWNEPAVAAILSSKRRIQRLRGTLEANDLRWLSAYISSKAAHSPALCWHQDWWCWDHPVSYRRAATQVAVLCYLTDTSNENGALRVLPGSHHRSTAMHAHLPEPHGEDASRLPPVHPAMTDHSDQITVSVRAGDAVLLDYRLLHGTHANAGPNRRDCILLSFLPDWLGLPHELKAHYAMHPALPREDEASSVMASRYAGLLPNFAGVPASVAVNRMAPAAFRIR